MKHPFTTSNLIKLSAIILSLNITGCTRAQQFDMGYRKGWNDGIRDRQTVYIRGYNLGRRMGGRRY